MLVEVEYIICLRLMLLFSVLSISQHLYGIGSGTNSTTSITLYVSQTNALFFPTYDTTMMPTSLSCCRRSLSQGCHHHSHYLSLSLVLTPLLRRAPLGSRAALSPGTGSLFSSWHWRHYGATACVCACASRVVPVRLTASKADSRVRGPCGVLGSAARGDNAPGLRLSTVASE